MTNGRGGRAAAQERGEARREAVCERAQCSVRGGRAGGVNMCVRAGSQARKAPWSYRGDCRKFQDNARHDDNRDRLVTTRLEVCSSRLLDHVETTHHHNRFHPAANLNISRWTVLKVEHSARVLHIHNARPPPPSPSNIEVTAHLRAGYVPRTNQQLTLAAAKKAKAAAVEFEEDDFASDDLFDEAQVEAASSGRGARRSALSDSILNRTSVRIGDLRKVVQLSDSVEDLQQLGTVLQSWRAQGKKVTDQTAVEIVGE